MVDSTYDCNSYAFLAILIWPEFRAGIFVIFCVLEGFAGQGRAAGICHAAGKAIEELQH